MNTNTRSKILAGAYLATSLLLSNPITAFSGQAFDSLRAAGSNSDLVFDGAGQRAHALYKAELVNNFAPPEEALSQAQAPSKPSPWKKAGEVAKKAMPYVGAAALGLFIGLFLTGALLPGILIATAAVLAVAAGGGDIFIGF